MPDCLANIPLGGPDGELSASMRYLAQRYTMPYRECMATLTDIGTEELAHLEMICAIVYQLTKNMTMEELKASGFDKYYVDHTAAAIDEIGGEEETTEVTSEEETTEAISEADSEEETTEAATEETETETEKKTLN